MKSGGASRTAVFVCQGRAVADGQIAVGRFSDPVAEQLLTDEELAPVRLARAGADNKDGKERLAVAAVLACAQIVVPRTVVIDQVVEDAVGGGASQVVLLGAGLDGRPWRLAALGKATVFSVDHPASQADALARGAALDPLAGTLVPVAVDLAEEGLGDALAEAGHDRDQPTVWVWEGVVPYLSSGEVERSVSAVAECSAPDSVLVVNYQSRSFTATVGRWVAGVSARAAGAESVLADEPWRSSWSAQAMTTLLGRHGFEVEDDVDLLGVARQLGTPTDRSRSLANGRVATARRDGPRRTFGS